MNYTMVMPLAPTAATFPKHCRCGTIIPSHEEWLKLPLVGVMPDVEGDLELRNCACDSTLAVALPCEEPTIAECRDCGIVEALRDDRCGFCFAMSSRSVPAARPSVAA